MVNLSTLAPIINHSTVMAFAVVYTDCFTFANVEAHETVLDAQP